MVNYFPQSPDLIAAAGLRGDSRPPLHWDPCIRLLWIMEYQCLRNERTCLGQTSWLRSVQTRFTLKCNLEKIQALAFALDLLFDLEQVT